MEKKIIYNSIKPLKQAGLPVVIVAAVIEAEAIVSACRDNGIEVSAICDSVKKKTKDLFCGLEVIHTPNLPERFPKARFIFAVQAIQDTLEQLSSLGYDEFYSALEILENFNVSKHQYLKTSQSYMEQRILVYKKSHAAYFDEKKLYMRSVDVMVTTKCSMKCESCANLMQYYGDPKNTERENILAAIDIIKENVDDIGEFRVIGGEPLMNKDWAHIVNGINEKNPDRQIFIYTNGTITPKDEQLETFQGKNVNFLITDYGKLSRNIEKLTEKLIKHGVSYVSNPVDGWVDCSSIRHHKRTVPQLKEVFKECCVKYFYTLLDGKLYRCPFIANATNLNAIPDNPDNYVDLFSKTHDVKQKIRRLVKTTSFFPACDFCDGRPYNPSNAKGYNGAGVIEPAIQTPKVLPYKVYK
jgi:organic radical activating enzyme